MINKQSPQPQETRWHYLGPDNEMYGPYTSKDMLFWLQSGYFTESLQLRTENETQYHSLGEWNSLLGTHPFNMPIYSMESLMSQIHQIRPPQPQMMIMPPGIAPPYPPPQLRYPNFMPMAPIQQIHQMNGIGPNGPQQQTLHQLHSQPPSEPIDAGSLSHTPDSENDIRTHEKSMKQKHTNAWFAELGLRANLPQVTSVSTETDVVSTKDSACQTEAIHINQKAASRILSELFGQTVVIKN